MSDIHAVIKEIRERGGGKGLWYLATPYAKYPFGKDEAARHAAHIAAEFINNGVAVFCPIAHGHTIQTNGGIQGHDVWLGLDELVMNTCRGIIVPHMPGWHFSKGVRWEIEWFAKKGISPFYCDVVEFLGLPDFFNKQGLSDEAEAKLLDEPQPHVQAESYGEASAPNPDPREDRQYRKDRPVATGVMDYFPLALAEVANISRLGNQQHNLGDSHLHWERTKSNDHADCIARHLSDRGGYGLDGAAHSGNLGWRALALIQEEQEDKLLRNGVHPCDVFSRAHTWHGKTKFEFWGPVGQPLDPSRENWVKAANEFWAQHEKDIVEKNVVWEQQQVDRVREDMKQQAAVSLRDMVHKWYTFAAERGGGGVEPPTISEVNIKRRLDRFFK